MRVDPFYQSTQWRRVSRYIRFVRALGHCERCGVPHGQISPDGTSVARLECAHLNGNRLDTRPANLRALCPPCHRTYDLLRRTRDLLKAHPELRGFLNPPRKRRRNRA
jgi:hypothetical protein